eukprot:EG_transcript_6248
MPHYGGPDSVSWRGTITGVHTPEMQALEAEIDQLDARMDELRVLFLQKEREYADEYDTVEAAFGKELEQVRKVDLRAKGDVLNRLDSAALDVPLSHQEGSDRYEELWRRKKQQILEEYHLREEDMTREHNSRVEMMQGELRALEARQKARQEEDKERPSGVPFLGLELAEHQGPGARVVKARGPCREAGVREGDVLLNAQLSKNIRTKKNLQDVIRNARPGQHLAFLVERSGQEHETVMAIPRR